MRNRKDVKHAISDAEAKLLALKDELVEVSAVVRPGQRLVIADMDYILTRIGKQEGKEKKYCWLLCNLESGWTWSGLQYCDDLQHVTRDELDDMVGNEEYELL